MALPPKTLTGLNLIQSLLYYGQNLFITLVGWKHMNLRSVSYIIIAACAITATGPAQPKLQVVGGTKIDLGSIYRGAVVERKVTLKNAGSDTLIVSRVDPSCGCTGTVVSNDHIGAGKTGLLLITFNSKNFSGPIHKSVTINSNAADEPRTMVEFTATVIDEIVLAPPQLWFKNAEVGKASTITLSIKNSGKDDLKLTGYRSQLQGFALKVPSDPIAPGKTVELVAEFKPERVIPVIGEAVFLSTNNPRQPEIYIPIYGNAKEFKFE